MSLEDFEQQGFLIEKAVLSTQSINDFRNILKPLSTTHGARAIITRFPALAEELKNTALPSVLAKLNMSSSVLVRSLYFDKPMNQNWGVAWHQDRVVALREKIATDGFKHWSWKDGFWQVEVPIELLNSIVVVRIALDDADERNGALSIIPQSHQEGDLSTEAIQKRANSITPIICQTCAGDAVIMKQLLIHSSTKNLTILPRRVLHLEFCNVKLPEPLQWAEAYQKWNDL